ncbi:MAG: hypothetical protein ACK528_06370, partial [Alphaproteobacteria bacterium]
MAEKDYYSDLYATPIETPLGTAGSIIAENLPAVVNPYASTGANFATVLGGGLLAGLLAYGAKREAEAQNRELTPKLLDVMSTTNQAELQQKLAQPGYEQLGGLGTRLQSALVEQQRKQAIEQAKQDAQLQRQKDLERYKRTDPELLKADEKQKRLEKSIAAEYAKTDKKGEQGEADWWEKMPAQQKSAYTAMPGQVNTLRNLAERFKTLDANAASLQLQALKPDSQAALLLAELSMLVPSTVKLLGDTGNLAVQEQENVKKQVLGGITSGSQSIAARLENLAKLAEEKTLLGLEASRVGATFGGDVLLSQMKAGTLRT